MKIQHIIIGLNVGGAELMLRRLIESHGGNRAFFHSVISLTDMGNIGSELVASGIEVQALEMRSALDIPRVLIKLTGMIRSSNPEIVQTWMYHADLLGGLAARFAGKHKVIWGIRTTDVQAGGARTTTIVRRICAWLSRFVPDTIVCAAEASLRAHVAVGYCAARMTVVPNGFDLSRLIASPEQRAMLRSRCCFDDKIVVVGTLGRFNRAKDQENFVCAAGVVASRHPEVRFLMIGRDLDHENRKLQRWILNTGYSDRFVLLGERTDVPVCLVAMDIFCLSSRTEGFPNVVGEAMAMGLPCVVTDVGDAAMLVADTGFVVPKEDPAALAASLEKMLGLGTEQRAALGAKAKQRITSEFTIERARQRFESIYISLSGQPGEEQSACVDS